jgi:hypothetical protein
MISNEKLDVRIRIWMEDVFIKNKWRDLPLEATELMKVKTVE